MRKNLDVLSLYPMGKELSNPPTVLIEWPLGLESPAVLYPLGNSLEESEEIRGLLEDLLGNRRISAQNQVSE